MKHEKTGCKPIVESKMRFETPYGTVEMRGPTGGPITHETITLDGTYLSHRWLPTYEDPRGMSRDVLMCLDIRKTMTCDLSKIESAQAEFVKKYKHLFEHSILASIHNQ